MLVSVSHSAPYEVPDSETLMRSFLADPNIDFLSPQPYSEGTAAINDYAPTSGVNIPWTDYANAKATVIPSLIAADLYANAAHPDTDAKEFMAQQGVETLGYVQWSQI